MSRGEAGRLMRVARLSMALSRRCLASYGSLKSRQDFTQPQLMTCLVLKAITKNDYRGIVELLALSPLLRQAIGLDKVPHYTTLQKFMARPGVDAAMRAVLDEVLKHAGVDADQPGVELTADSTGFQSGLASEHYRTRRGITGKARRYVKVSAAVICGLLLPAGLVVDLGPSNDMKQMPALLEQAGARTRPSLLLADRGYDAEWVHRLCHEQWNARCMIPVRQEKGKLTRSHYRAAQGQLPKTYSRRWQVESYFSGLKRTTLSTLSSRSVPGMLSEATLKVLAYAILR